jgi:hypothetical protein
MKYRRTGSGRLALAIVALVAMTTRAEAQRSRPIDPTEIVVPPSQGDWAEVMTVTPTWLVLQNQRGQQFPVSRALVDLFLIRWPTSPDRLAANSWVEATGFSGGANRILTDHVDVFQGTSRSLVPGARLDSFNEKGQFLIPLLMDTYETAFGDNFQFTVPTTQLSTFLHIVGQVVNRNPLAVGTTDNAQVTVLGPQGSPPMTLVTFGSESFAAFVQPGDVVWYDTTNVGPRGLSLAQLMVYKTVPYAP